MKHSKQAGGAVIQVPGRHVKVRRDEDIGRAEAHRRFGGVDVPASLVGMLAALAMLMLGGILAAALGASGAAGGGGFGVSNADDIGTAGVVGGAITIALACLVGGWAAARMARYDGVRNGLMTIAWLILLALAVGAGAAMLDSRRDVIQQSDLPRWSTVAGFTTGTAIGIVVAILVAVGAAALGGWWGERFHRHADATIANTRDGAIPRASMTREAAR